MSYAHKYHAFAVPDDWQPVTEDVDLGDKVVALYCTVAGTLVATTAGSGTTDRTFGAVALGAVVWGRFTKVDATSGGTFLAGVAL